MIAGGSERRLVRSKRIAAGRNRNIFVQMQWLVEELIDHVVRSRINFGAVVEENPDAGCPLAINQLAGSIGIVAHKHAEIQLTYIEHAWARRKVELHDGWLVVDAG